MAPEGLDTQQARLAQARAEAIAKLTEYELLGLDKPTKDQLLSNRDEAEHVPKVVYLLHQSGKNEVMMREILARFNLNDGVYDPTENPRGIFEADTKDKNRLMILLVVRLIGANSYVVTTFFASKNSTKGLSRVALAAVDEAHERRERFPVDHPSEFPSIRNALNRIERLGGPTVSGIFHPNATIPPVGDWIMRKGNQAVLTFEQVLMLIGDALSGEKTEADIARDRRIPTSTVNSIIARVKKGKNQVLSDELLDLIAVKIKKGK